MPKKVNWRLVKSHRSYTIDEVARRLCVSKGTVRRWIKVGLPALTDQRPFLILGDDLIKYLKKPAKPASKCEPHQCYCFTCKVPRAPAFHTLEYRPFNATNGQLRALCEQCSTVMHKGASEATLKRIGTEFTIEIKRANQRLINGTEPPSNDHFKPDP